LSEDPEKRRKRLEHLRCDEAGYNFRSLPAHVQLAAIMRSRGIRVDPGQRLEYVVVKTDESSKCLFDKLEDKDYQAKFPFIVPIDYLYYIKALCVPLDQLLVVVFKKEKMFTMQYKIFVNYNRVVEQIKMKVQTKINLIE
jgi:DNA polymerase elongation subunit (family B)